eukprot:GFUD01024469.1.p1 GENE.GFUD01024469.1~~GFUD01024469.1.p1  ORF type:complete len:179 (-),score=0.25 GFUD01024469.1:37-573(-)
MYAERMLASLFFIGCFDLDVGQVLVGCKTVAHSCVFPRTYDGITYNECTTKYSKPWCAAEVDCDRRKCADGFSRIAACKTSWVTCIFPFKYKGNTYDKCTTKDAQLPWCATAVDKGDGNQVIEGQWVDCFDGCYCDGCFGLGISTMAATTQEGTTLSTTTLGDTTNSSTMAPTSTTII